MGKKRIPAPKVIGPSCAGLAGPIRLEHSSTATNPAMIRSKYL